MESDPSFFYTSLFLFISFVLVALNGFFVAAEFSIVKVRRTRLESLAGKGNNSARESILIVDQMDEYLSATQLGITLVSLGLGAVGERAFFDLIRMLLPEHFTDSSTLIHALATGLSFSIITLLHVVLGELVPKSMAIQQAEKITLLISRPLSIFYRFAKPLINIFTALANFILRRLGYHGEEESALSEEELKIVMKESHDEGVISESEAQIINRAFEFSDKRVRDIMIPLEGVQFLSLDRTVEQNIEVTQKRMYTRFPLTNSDLNSVVGVVHMKDALVELHEHRTNDAFIKVARPAIFIDPRMRQDKLMKIFKVKKSHLAVVQDPKTLKNIGIVTLEDILEELVGEIVDEHGN